MLLELKISYTCISLVDNLKAIVEYIYKTNLQESLGLHLYHLQNLVRTQNEQGDHLEQER